MATCGSCGAPIVWCVTENGKRMPVDEVPTEDGNVMKLWVDEYGNFVVRVMGKVDAWLSGRRRYTSHFATCPDAPAWRRR